MSTHNISFYGEINKNTPKLSPNTLLICSTVDNKFLYISHKISYRPAFLSLSICLYINMYAFVELQKKDSFYENQRSNLSYFTLPKHNICQSFGLISVLQPFNTF